MKKALIISMGFILSACATTQTKIQNAEKFANDLELSTDPIDIIKAYNAVNGQCDKYAMNKSGISIFDKQTQECYNELSVSIPGTEFGCMEKEFNGSEFYDSDDCIIYRRNHANNAVIFDYKRFLPKNSPITTDEKFKTWVNYFNSSNGCKKNENTTTTEYADCMEKVQENTRNMAKQLVDCKTAYEKEYTKLLKEQGEWYEYQLDFDPRQVANLAAAVGDYFSASIYASKRKMTYSEIVSSVKQDISDFGIENFCSTKNWKQQMRELGYKL